jgi:hypothetical protein
MPPAQCLMYPLLKSWSRGAIPEQGCRTEGRLELRWEQRQEPGLVRVQVQAGGAGGSWAQSGPSPPLEEGVRWAGAEVLQCDIFPGRGSNQGLCTNHPAGEDKSYLNDQVKTFRVRKQRSQRPQWQNSGGDQSHTNSMTMS